MSGTDAQAAPAPRGAASGSFRNPWAVVGLSFITLGIYYWVWYYRINRELGDYARRQGSTEEARPWNSVLALTVGSLIIVPAYVTMYRTFKRIHDAQENERIVPQVQPGNGLVLFVLGHFFLPWEALYAQSGLNKVWAAQSGLPVPARDRGLGLADAIAAAADALPGPTTRVWREVKARLVIAFIALVVGFVLLAVFRSLDVAAFYAWIVFVAIYVPPYDRVPRYGRFIRPGIFLAIAICYPFFWDKMFTVPILGEWPDISTGVYMLVFIMMAIGLNIVVGYAGLLDLGYVAFYAMGAYTTAWFSSVQFAHRNIHFWAVGVGSNVPGIHISIWILLVLAGLLTAMVGVIIGLPTLRLRGDYLAIVTLGFGEIMPQIARNGDNLFGTGFNLTNGPNGITPIDSPGFFHVNYLTGSGTFFTSERLFYWTAILLILITIFCSIRLRDSRLGRAWIAIREDETAAAAMGVPLMRTKTWAYATGAFFGGVAGAYYASFKSATFPGDFFFNISVFILCMVILGGMGNITGVIVGAAFLAYLDREGLANTGTWLNQHLGLNIEVPKYEFGIFGVILLVVMLFRPEGLIPSKRRKAELHEGVHDEPLYDVAHGAGMSEELHGYDTETAEMSAATDNLLVATDLRKEFGGLVAVNDVEFAVPRGTIVSLIGPNGAGKTTFFNMLTGVYKPTAGDIAFDGEVLTGKPPHAFTQRGIGRTFQNIRLFQNMTSVENVLVGMHSRLTGGIVRSILRGPLTPGLKREEADARKRAHELLVYSGLRNVEEELAKNLSYGDQRRLEVARALATQPKLLLLDEPTAGMNPQETADFTAFVSKLRAEEGLTVLLIEHDMRVVMGVSDRVTVLDYGEKIAEGTPDEVRRDPRVIEAYLGKEALAHD